MNGKPKYRLFSRVLVLGALGIAGCASSETSSGGTEDAPEMGPAAGASAVLGSGGTTGAAAGAGGAAGSAAAAGTGGNAGIASANSLGTATLVLDPNGRTPLAAELRVLFSGHADLAIAIEGEASWRVSSEGTDGVTVPLLGFKPSHEYRVTVTLTIGSESQVLGPMTLVTPSLPADFPVIELVRSTPEKMAPGHTLFSSAATDTGTYLVVIDERGEVVWYYLVVGLADVRELPNGNLLFFDRDEIVEMTYLGSEVRRLKGAAGEHGYNHEVFPAPNGNLYTLGSSVKQVEGMRTSYDDASLRGTVEVTDSVLIELDAQGNELRRKALLDILDRERVAYDSLQPAPVLDTQNDWSHANAVIPVDHGSGFVLSARNQDAVFKLSQDWSELRWLLANPVGWSEAFRPYLLTPVRVPAGKEFRWPYHQHAPEQTRDGMLLLFDNGNHRATPGDGRTPMTDETSYSRAVEYRIDEQAMTVQEVWSFEYPDARLFSFAMGDANLQADSNTVLITYGMMSAIGDVQTEAMGWGWVQARLVEVARDAGDEVVFDLSVHGKAAGGFGCPVYRALRIAAIR
jgi:arylsulfate sulfotransferase